MDLQRLSPTLGGLSGRVEPEGLPTFLPRSLPVERRAGIGVRLMCGRGRKS